ncbi:hypothetical protein B0A49_07863 [Cryomyces minteri]|uniref:Arsenical-resistance protein n=1 Tax=Cryomyces minteri TaxID=331657 RepID=A0A4U0WMX4_9PEZI|nr:hypothetical protein B0A49_07863 [Cryomyces minteri]
MVVVHYTTSPHAGYAFTADARYTGHTWYTSWNDTVEHSVADNPKVDGKLPPVDLETERGEPPRDIPALKGLSILDRFLVVRTILATAIGIILANLVPSTGPTLQRGEFAGVLFWTDLAGGDRNYCAVLVAFNSILKIVLFAPLAVFYIKIASHDLGQDFDTAYQNVPISVAVFLGIPLSGCSPYAADPAPVCGRTQLPVPFHPIHRPFFVDWSALTGLLYTIIVLFTSQGAHVIRKITSVLRVCAPLVIYFFTVFSVTVWPCWKFGFGYRVSCTQSFTAASNSLGLAIAVAVAVYGAGSGQALASTVRPLIEVPVLVALVYVLKYVKKRSQWKD